MYIVVKFLMFGYSRQNPTYWPDGHVCLKDGKAELVDGWRDATRLTLSEAIELRNSLPSDDRVTWKIYEVCLDIDQEPYLEPVV